MSDITSELKKQLLESSDDYKDEIQVALKQVVDRLGKTGINIAVISGTLLISYLMYRGLTNTSKKKNKKSENEMEDGDLIGPEVHSMIDRLADKVLEQTLVFLLTLAKDRLMAYLNSLSEDYGDTEASSKEE